MPKKIKHYNVTKFPANVLRLAFEKIHKQCNEEFNPEKVKTDLTVEYSDETWTFDSLAEFLVEYRKEIKGADVLYSPGLEKIRWFAVSYRYGRTMIRYEAPDRLEVEDLFDIFEEEYNKYKIDENELRNLEKQRIKDRIKIFIGHGRSSQWRDLKDHLQDKHGYKVIAYETGARAGMTITEVLQELTSEASLALLVHTAEDLDKDAVFHARENVIHEQGLFQGVLGARRAIILLEEGANEYTNIAGVQQLRYTSGNIKEIYGDVISIIEREFGGK
ncbi:hypothetical protein J2T17_004699 [Paenibacillus mucilaginosus]|uniref:TIR domain-containing protein n=1 Tax=Paenibacillus mucilaginosus TaxID=61624 RepID=UPI003D1DD4B6